MSDQFRAAYSGPYDISKEGTIDVIINEGKRFAAYNPPIAKIQIITKIIPTIPNYNLNLELTYNIISFGKIIASSKWDNLYFMGNFGPTKKGALTVYKLLSSTGEVAVAPPKDKDAGLTLGKSFSMKLTGKDNNFYTENDTYYFDTYFSNIFDYENPDTLIYVSMYRDARTVNNGIYTGLTHLEDVKEAVLYPSIFIKSQTLIDGSNIGSTTFEVHYVDNIKFYEKNCVDITPVLKGEGDLLQRVYDLPIGSNITNVKFSDNLIQYSLLKYLLSKLLYGCFNVNYLLRKNHEKFLIDLEKSIYRNFVSFFTTGSLSSYINYFLFNAKENSL